MEDLYPKPSWNYVFGQATLRNRIGVYSFARYDPAFYHEPRPADWRGLMLRRSCKVLAHETGHMFEIHYCTAFHCLMNGSNHLQEADARPLHLCPVDLRKLHYSVGFDPVERYRKLLAFSEKVGFQDEAPGCASGSPASRGEPGPPRGLATPSLGPPASRRPTLPAATKAGPSAQSLPCRRGRQRSQGKTRPGTTRWGRQPAA